MVKNRHPKYNGVNMNFKRESIFISALRCFFNTFSVLIGIGVAFFVIGLGFSTLSTSNVTMPDKAELVIGADANGKRALLDNSKPVILQIDVHGIIGLKNLKAESFSNFLLTSREGLLEKDRVKAILLHMNTPGGIATDSNTIYHMLKSYKETYKVPILAYIEGICASGGMYIAAAADQIFASEDSVVGSIGVRMGPTFNFSTAMEKVGISSLTLTEGKDKDALNPFRPWKEGEDAAIKAVLATEYAQFVDVMTKNRKKLDKEKLINEYGAQIFIAQKGEELGYIDNGNISYVEALKTLVTAAEIKGDYQVFKIRPAKNILKELSENKWGILQGKLEHVLPLGPYMTSDMSGKLLYLYQP